MWNQSQSCTAPQINYLSSAKKKKKRQCIILLYSTIYIYYYFLFFGAFSGQITTKNKWHHAVHCYVSFTYELFMSWYASIHAHMQKQHLLTLQRTRTARNAKQKQDHDCSDFCSLPWKEGNSYLQTHNVPDAEVNTICQQHATMWFYFESVKFQPFHAGHTISSDVSVCPE